MAAALVGVLAVLAYSLTLTKLPSEVPIPLWLLLVIGVVQNLLIFGAASWLGLWLGGRVGLGAPLLRSWLSGDRQAGRRFRSSLSVALLSGAAVGLAIFLLERLLFLPLLPEALRAMNPPAPWQGFLASFYGGINEELLTRLGLMTLLAWLRARLARLEAPSRGVMWTANVVAALLFGAGHLPTLSALAPLTVILVVRTLLLNGTAGVVFGWFYWRRGLLVVMAAHFSADVVLHVFGAALA
jgi:hypothetical protein